ncbi:putative thymidine kinase [Trypanosoma rangeli]|uniref:Thymidine kinase n=1 Tax=Trypanosoma rangeli TaxID=5698 RepID=A0A3R7M8B4_TRYRA|nr:putative thymidine kinase [Trypanosoma rangeli]RNF01284.1 putative thymidine kinase [Trypanosoma rangeli]|eukprot:RNF01284.1 putative thymidine kinase [Trypanosoma rangeli]
MAGTGEDGCFRQGTPVGRLELIIGPMFAGKTSALIHRVSRLRAAKHRCLVVTHRSDTRYRNAAKGKQQDNAEVSPSFDWELTTHSHHTLFTADVAVSALWELKRWEVSANTEANCRHVGCGPGGNNTTAEERSREDGGDALDWREYDVIAIDEGQFFADLYIFCTAAVAMGKWVFVASLDGDCHQQLFGDVCRLIPHCEVVEKLSAICMRCRTRDAFFTHRRVEVGEVVVVGGAELYEPVCRHCLADVSPRRPAAAKPESN